MKDNGKMDLRKVLVSRKNQTDQNILAIGYKENEMEKEKLKIRRIVIMRAVFQWE